MKLTVVGCGDAWGSGGRGHTCFRLDSDGRVFVVDFGASAIVGWHKLGYSTNEIDAIVISHLHGDHFGGLPFLLLNAQYDAGRKRPLSIIGPPGTRDRLDRAIDVFYAGAAAGRWRFEWTVEEVTPGRSTEIFDARVSTVAVEHGEQIDATGIRLEHGGKTFAYSGDTEWTDALISLSDRADFFVVECFSPAKEIVGHLNWPRLRDELPRFRAKRVALTHMNAAMRDLHAEARQAGLEVLDDGDVIEF
jgi:ribonuclease BN (tRNA processing enzyme)